MALEGGRGNSEGNVVCVDKTLVPLVVNDDILLVSLVVDRPRLFLCPLCLGPRLEDECLAIPPAVVLPMAVLVPALSLFLSRRRCNARLLGEVSDSCLDILAISAGIEKLSCGADRAADGRPHSGMFESALIISSPIPIDDARLFLVNLLDHLDILLVSWDGRCKAASCGGEFVSLGLDGSGAGIASIPACFSISRCIDVVTTIVSGSGDGIGREIALF